MKHQRHEPAAYHTEPEPVRRKLAAAYRKRASDKQFTEAERVEFMRMADTWAATLPEKK